MGTRALPGTMQTTIASSAIPVAFHPAKVGNCVPDVAACLLHGSGCVAVVFPPMYTGEIPMGARILAGIGIPSPQTLPLPHRTGEMAGIILPPP